MSIRPDGPATELVLEGHIIDSMILPRVWDMVMDMGGNFEVLSFDVGRHKTDPSVIRMLVWAADQETLDEIVKRAMEFGATRPEEQEAQLAEVDRDGVYPEGFYSSSNLETRVLVGGRWITVERQEMDCAIAVDVDAGRAWCSPFSQTRAGMRIVVGHQGVKVIPQERSRNLEIFGFMSSEVSSEKPKKVVIQEIAREMRSVREGGGKVLVVAGPAVVHTGAGRYLTRLIELGYIQTLFAGNALATHDIESALYGTSLGVSLDSGLPIESGHEHHMRAINRVRRAGSIAAMVESGELQSGIMKSCVDHGVEVVLGGSVRDDGPLPDTITDVVEAQDRMRELVPGVRVALMLSTMLHSIATGNLLPASVRTVCVDINPAVVTKLADRGSWQSVGLVTDVESFLRELLSDLETGPS